MNLDAFPVIFGQLETGISEASRELAVNADGFYVVPVPGFSLFQVGASRDAVVFVINDASLLTREFSGDVLRVRTGLPCALKSGGESKVEKIALIELRTKEVRLVSSFLSVLSALILRSRSGRNFSIEEFIDSMIEIFSKSKAATVQDAQGLFGELVAISLAIDIPLVLMGWRNSPDDRFDFAIDNQRVEVKTTTGLRKHHFSYEQLSPSTDLSVYVCSIQTMTSADGLSVGDLLRKILEAVDDEELGYIAYKKAYGSIDVKIEDLNNFRFDYQVAASSLKYFWCNDVPRVHSLDFGVSEVRFVSDLQSCPSLFGDRIAEIKGFGCP